MGSLEYSEADVANDGIFDPTTRLLRRVCREWSQVWLA